MEELKRLVGCEYPLHEIDLALKRYVGSLHAPVVGAMHVTCADEAEHECIEAFQRDFVAPLVPELKFTQKAPFRLCNLGGRYEWGALAVAEHHYATAEAKAAYKVLLVKVSSHVAVEGTGPDARYGEMQRYGERSTACGALRALLTGGNLPFLDDLREAFTAERQDRLSALQDRELVEPAYRSLFAAIVNARRQARRVEQEIWEVPAASPTLYFVASCVTLNRAERDTELFCGIYSADHRTDTKSEAYFGLGDDPTRYRIGSARGRLQVRDEPATA